MQSLSNFFRGGRVTSAPHPQPQSSQPQSPHLLTLPLEIRLMIYKSVISSWGWGERIHILEVETRDARKNNKNNNNKPEMKLTYFPCFHQHEERGGEGEEKGVVYEEWCTGPTNRFEWTPLFNRRYLSLFQTCRQINQEALPLLYSTHTFQFSSLPCTLNFLSLVPQESLNSIKELTIHNAKLPRIFSPYLKRYITPEQRLSTTAEWSSFLSTLSLMSEHSLTKLRINITYLFQQDEDNEGVVLASFAGANIKIPREGFIIQLPKRVRVVEGEGEEMGEGEVKWTIERREQEGGRWGHGRFPLDLDVEAGPAYRKWRGAPRSRVCVDAGFGNGNGRWWEGLRKVLNWRGGFE